jgi:hypothetical protein
MRADGKRFTMLWAFCMPARHGLLTLTSPQSGHKVTEER